MTMYLKFDNQALSDVRNRELLTEVYGPPKPGAVTTHLVQEIVHPDTDEAALVIPEKWQLYLTTDEQAALVDTTTMTNEGWFD